MLIKKTTPKIFQENFKTKGRFNKYRELLEVLKTLKVGECIEVQEAGLKRSSISTLIGKVTKEGLVLGVFNVCSLRTDENVMLIRRKE